MKPKNLEIGDWVANPFGFENPSDRKIEYYRVLEMYEEDDELKVSTEHIFEKRRYTLVYSEGRSMNPHSPTEPRLVKTNKEKAFILLEMESYNEI